MTAAGQRGPLTAIAAVPEVSLAVERARDTCAQLRWHPALRRRAEEARVEAGIWAAQASADADGARLPLAVVRDIARGAVVAPTDAVGLTVMGALRAESEGARLAHRAAQRWKESARQALARLHTASGAGLVPDEEIGRPLPGAQERLDSLVDLLQSTGGDPAPVVSSVVQAEVASGGLFAAVPGVMSRAASRSLTMGLGLDPMGVAVPELVWARQPQRLAAGLEAYRSGTLDGVATWVVEWCEAMVEGCEVGRAVCDSIMAGVLRN